MLILSKVQDQAVLLLGWNLQCRKGIKNAMAN